jgi:UDP-glucose 4-epimerase
MKVLVTGACGYIGSHALRCLQQAGHTAVALDNLSRGHRESLPPSVPLVELDVRDTDGVFKALQEHEIECVMHFAALAYAGESVDQPNLYYDNNTGGTLSLLRAIDRAGVKRMVFSSTCSTTRTAIAIFRSRLCVISTLLVAPPMARSAKIINRRRT